MPAVHLKSSILYVAYTSNYSVDVIDSRQDKYLRSIPNLVGVAGVLVSNEKDVVFTSNRGENTVGVFKHGKDRSLHMIKVGGRPNGLAFDASRNSLLAANVPKPNSQDPTTVSIVDVAQLMTADVTVPSKKGAIALAELRSTLSLQGNHPSYAQMTMPRPFRNLYRGFSII
jgi:DNA-binding beta-propeller fold protein YncE